MTHYSPRAFTLSHIRLHFYLGGKEISTVFCLNSWASNLIVSHFFVELLTRRIPTGHRQKDWIFRSEEMSSSSVDGVNLHIPKKVSRTTVYVPIRSCNAITQACCFQVSLKMSGMFSWWEKTAVYVVDRCTTFKIWPNGVARRFLLKPSSMKLVKLIIYMFAVHDCK